MVTSRERNPLLKKFAYVLLATVWTNIPEALQWPIAWLVNPKVVIGVSGVVFNERKEVLLLKHRFHKKYPWGLPGGWVNRGENLADALVRELREETNYDVRVEGILEQRRSSVLCMEFYLKARIVGGHQRLDSNEILGAEFCSPDHLPDYLHRNHVRAIRLAQGSGAWNQGVGIGKPEHARRD